MKKKHMAIAKKALVWSLAASMLVATPLTASAKDLNQIFKVEDAWGREKPGYDPKNNSETGTVTATESNSGVMKGQEKILGIVLDETDVNLEMFKDNADKKNITNLTATILPGEGLGGDEVEKLEKTLKWSSSNNKVVALESSRDGKVKTMTLNAKGPGSAKVTVSLDSEKYDIHFTATANVTVKQYAEKLEFSEQLLPVLSAYPLQEELTEEEQTDNVTRFGYLGQSVDLNEALEKSPTTANDEIIFEIKEAIGANGKAANIATLKNGMLKYTKAGTLTIVAVGEKEDVTAEAKIKIMAGAPASKVEIWLDKANQVKKAPAQKVDVADKDQRKIEVIAKLYTKKNGKDALTEEQRENLENCTDQVKWSTKKDTVVTVKAVSENSDKAVITPTGVGSTTIEATTTTGKKTSLKVTVDATMTDIKIETVDVTAPDYLYAGQTKILEATTCFGDGKEYENFPGAGGVTWYVPDKTEAKWATIKKDALTIKPTSVGDSITVKVKSAKKYKSLTDARAKAAVVEPSSERDKLKIELKKVDIRQIIVTEIDANGNKKDARLAGVNVDKKKDKTENKSNGSITINGGKNRRFEVKAFGPDGEVFADADHKVPLAATLAIASSSVKLAEANLSGEIATVTAIKGNKGKATITVSGTTITKAATDKKPATYGAIKTSFKADVKNPTSYINLTTKSKAIAVKTNNKGVVKQTITYTAAIDKKSSSNVKLAEWKAYLLEDGEAPVAIAPANIKNGKITLTEYKAGQRLKVSVVLKDKDDVASDSVSATIITPIVSPSTEAEIRNADSTPEAIFTEGKKNNQTTIYLLGTEGKSITLAPKVNVGDKASKKGAITSWLNPNDSDGQNRVAADVTYSVNKKGIVSIVGNKVTGIKAGTVKITATTADNKKATLTVVVKNDKKPASTD